MSNAGLSYGLNIKKKTPGNRPQPAKRKPIFDEPDDSDNEDGNEGGIEEIGEIDGLSQKPSKPTLATRGNLSIKPSKNGRAPKKAPISMYGDLSATFTSKKHADTAEELDPSIYDYDAVYESLKPKKKVVTEDEERKPKYMTNLLAAAAVRKRDATIAEEKKLARDREAEGDEFADKEKFVTSAYKKQQEENRRLEAEERLKEEQEQKKNKGAGMTNFYKNMLEQGEQQHAEIVKAAEEAAKNGPMEREEEEKQKSDAEIAREISEKTGAKIAVNDEGQVVDKRQLLKGGLNVIPKPKSTAPATAARGGASMSDRSRGPGFVGAGGGKQAMRERQSRMMETQLQQATKRALEEEEEEKQKIERASKSRKTEGDIMSAKERYLARKKEAEEAKKRGEVP
ncbi:Nuclear speckle splicing regulatory protein 1-like protein [Lachnellula hyalina]|uniref:Nuclear speckle splicing regulatory protein 1-like protein n=1 Tax=Lachnellula hyalina TaxID=1316788 RepID=A0A8H8R976_9HELO|nr:Nuclear speckle splicing regulatory protein 1-like protein [Lachnellula hyalina]TVY30741.1 Nuclear speckle splicing regulatory protein 1-like protein [Lachnellula hyalina]